MTETLSLVWFRRDLRLADNPALSAAAAEKRPVAALYIHDSSRRFSPGGAQKWFIHRALQSLRRDLEEIGVPLLLRAGPEQETLIAAAVELGAGAVYWNRRYAAEDIETDAAVKERLSARGVKVSSFNGSLLREPWEVTNGTGGPYRVFTPFWKTLAAAGPSRREIAAPKNKAPVSRRGLKSDDADCLRLPPKSPNWAAAFEKEWDPGESGAQRALGEFLSGPANSYGEDRNRPDLRGTSRLSPHLAVGTISPLSIWNGVQSSMASGVVSENEGRKFLSEIAWREFAYHLLYHNPLMPTEPLRAAFGAFAWREDDRSFRAWTRGATGVPIVDAGMRELWRTGWMHNRVRMIVASFLVKNLLIDWRKGERWFWDTLVDADPANNPASWQWVAGCGADAAPYFRIFNPVTQGEKFDPDGAYVRKFVPEIAALPAKFIHAPWKAPGISARLAYPPPIVDPDQSRKRALAVYSAMKTGGEGLEQAASDA